jgi:hypothetical protein
MKVQAIRGTRSPSTTPLTMHPLYPQRQSVRTVRSNRAGVVTRQCLSKTNEPPTASRRS